MELNIEIVELPYFNNDVMKNTEVLLYYLFKW